MSINRLLETKVDILIRNYIMEIGDFKTKIQIMMHKFLNKKLYIKTCRCNEIQTNSSNLIKRTSIK